MKKGIIYLIILIVVIILQTSFLPLFSPGKFYGDMVLMLILAGAILDGFFDFFWFAIWAGIIYDFIAYSTIGASSLIFLLVVYAVSFFSRRFTVEFRGVGLIFLEGFIIIFSLISRLAVAAPFFWKEKAGKILLGAFGGWELFILEIFYNTLLFFICFTLLKKIKIFFAID